MKILIAPLNWGLGHATRCAELVRRYMAEGHEVVLGGDGESLVWLRRAFPNLRYVELASLELTYSKGKSQVGAMLRALPKLVRFSLEDEARLEQLLRTEPFDLVVSDNRFGLHSKRTRCVYITHQLWIRLPHSWRWFEPLAARLHARIYNRYDEVWVPDYGRLRVDDAQCTVDDGQCTVGLSGMLGHPNFSRLTVDNAQCTKKIHYIGPLSRFDGWNKDRYADGIKTATLMDTPYAIVCLLSSLEPQRSILEQQVRNDYANKAEKVLLVRGKVKEPFTKIQHGNMTIVPWLDDDDLAAALQGAERIICRSGYSTIMDLDRLGVLDKATFVPTPGQPEQEYLAQIHAKRTANTLKK